MSEKLKEKIGEALTSVLPITAIVILICFFITPVSSELILMFLVGALFLIFGISFFTLGAETAMSLIGERIGANLSKSKNLWFITLIAFIVGVITTIAEPDLHVLATQINEVPNFVLVCTVGIGVGLFLAIAMLRIVCKVKLSKLLVLLYIIVFVVSFFVPPDFLPLAFDSGGVTTGPLTVPFIIALGIGAASIRNDKESESDSFGLVALCSIGPILSVMVLGLLYKISGAQYIPLEITQISNSKDIGTTFFSAIPQYSLDVLISLIPIIVFFVLYNFLSLKLPKNEFKKTIVGLCYTFIGLVIFLIGVNVGFLPVGNKLGMALMGIESKVFIIPIMQVIGFFVVKAEPAVQILSKQVNDITDGMVSEKAMLGTLSIGMAFALVASVIRAWIGTPIYYILIPGYAVALALTFFSPEIFTAIAFDSGGVISGPLTASFLLPLMIGVCEASGRANASVMQDAFGLISMVAMVPLIAIQVVGINYFRKSKNNKVDSKDSRKEDEIIVFPKKVVVKNPQG